MTPEGMSSEHVDHRPLNRWLAVATKGLSHEARARIREEITDHFHESVDVGLHRGLSERDAVAGAIESLGSPTRARGAFRRTYLTRWQAYWVRRLIASPAPRSSETPWMLSSALRSSWHPDEVRMSRPWGYAIFIVMQLLLVEQFRQPTVVAISSMTLTLAGYGALIYVVPQLARRNRLRDAVALGAVSELAFWGGIFVGPALMRERPLGLTLSIYGIAAATLVIFHLPVLCKLGNEPRRPA
jgi:hypothetical protein